MALQSNKSKLKMRKKPVQSRSDFTVNVILEAAVRIITEQGLGSLTTNAVAETAGVSVGSIYQYFPGTESLVAELRQRHRQEISVSLRGAVVSAVGGTFKDLLQLTVAAMVEVHAENPRLHYWLAKYRDVGLEVGPEEPRFSFSPEENSLLVQFLKSHNLPSSRAIRMGRVMYEVVDSLLHAALIHEELDLPPEELVEEIMCVLLGYFERSGVACDADLPRNLMEEPE